MSFSNSFAMSGSNYLLDTNIILYLFAGNKELAKYLQPHTLFVSIISEMEVLGFQKLSSTQERQMKQFFLATRRIGIDETIKEQAISLRKTYKLKLPDAIIAATGISLGLPLLTADKQFEQVAELSLEIFQPE
ncbi:MAG: type II toxin-antitoxin system VapC family toxin [Chitinophagaceae bacterium]|nr:MAG: type II toxin-antitoxin system VapC family toxin [Chitinophagaceae bacterium]